LAKETKQNLIKAIFEVIYWKKEIKWAKFYYRARRCTHKLINYPKTSFWIRDWSEIFQFSSENCQIIHLWGKISGQQV
jgi:hypothetical protein